MKTALELHGELVADPAYREGDDPALDDRIVMLEAIISGARQARCPSCKTERPSSPELPFFEYRGPGSSAATDACANCCYYDVAHEGPRANSRICDSFVPHGAWDVDLFYCGCRGWD